MATNGLANRQDVRKQPRSILLLEILCVCAVASVLAAVVTCSGTLTSSNHGGIYMFAMLFGLSSFVLIVALLLEQLKPSLSH